MRGLLTVRGNTVIPEDVPCAAFTSGCSCVLLAQRIAENSCSSQYFMARVLERALNALQKIADGLMGWHTYGVTDSHPIAA